MVQWLSICLTMKEGFQGGASGQESACNAADVGLTPVSGRSPGGRLGDPLQSSCLENPHGQRSLVGYSLQHCKESDTTEAPWPITVQETWVLFLIREDLTCHGATKPKHPRAHDPHPLKPLWLETVAQSKRSHRNEEAHSATKTQHRQKKNNEMHKSISYKTKTRRISLCLFFPLKSQLFYFRNVYFNLLTTIKIFSA